MKIDQKIWILASFTLLMLSCSERVVDQSEEVKNSSVFGSSSDGNSSDGSSSLVTSSPSSVLQKSSVLGVSSSGLSSSSGQLITARMKSLPAGCFNMGQTGVAKSEPVHQVCVSAFYMDSTEVTQGDYLAQVGRNPSNYYHCGKTCPVERVSWSDADDYCKSIGARLPTEAEWEYAVRAGTTSTYYWCEDTTLATISKYTTSKISAVAKKLPNAFGLYDMNGNVSEWVSDWSGEYSASNQQDPTGAKLDSLRVIRGGAWVHSAEYLRSATRSFVKPEVIIDFFGFRCAYR